MRKVVLFVDTSLDEGQGRPDADEEQDVPRSGALGLYYEPVR